METPRPSVKLFYALNGYATLERVHKIFYDKIYAHPILGQFFKGHEQAFIEKQQTNFMAEKFGGPRNYLGKEPKYAHAHMYITTGQFAIRQQLLRESLIEAGIEDELMERWLTIDAAFQKAVVKEGFDQFMEQHTYKDRVIVS